MRTLETGLVLFICMFGVIWLMLNLAGVPGQGLDWTAIGQGVTPFIFMIVAFTISIVLIRGRGD